MIGGEDESLLARKLASVAALTGEELEAIRKLPLTVREIPARQDIVRLGDRPTHCCLVMAGLAFRYKVLGDGRRQILNFHVPGDIPDLQSLHLTTHDHNFAALTALTIGFIPHAAVHQLNARFPRVAGALWRDTLIDAALLRERIVSIGQRDGLSRTAHFLCEMFVRLQVVGLADAGSMLLPITQNEIADALGMSFVHVNRMIKELRERGLINVERQMVVLVAWESLKVLADFDPVYLHLAPGDRPTRT